MAKRIGHVVHEYTKKRTSIGNSVRSNPTNKSAKRISKPYNRQGK